MSTQILRFAAFWAACFLGFGVLPALAQDRIDIDIFGPGQQQLNMYSAPVTALDADQPEQVALKLRKAILTNLDFLPFLSQTPGSELLGGPALEGVRKAEIDFKRFRLAQVDLLLSIGWKSQSDALGVVELRLIDVFSQNVIVGKGYTIEDREQVPVVADRFCAALLQELAGNGDFFRSRLAFVRQQGEGKNIWTVGPQGRGLHQVTRMEGVSMSPAWSWDMRRLVFTYLDERRHRLGLWDRDSGQIKAMVLAGNTLISPVFTPEGEVVLSLDPHGNPDIFMLNDNWEIEKSLVQHWGIDISPQFDAQGETMVFVSSRLGNPHIFARDMESGEVQRVSFSGKYNTSPVISPDGRFVAYSRRTENGHRIMVHDLESGESQQITEGPGNDEEPTWAPDGYFLAFSSDRSGTYQLYLTTRNGDSPKHIPTGSGSATAPAWSPASP